MPITVRYDKKENIVYSKAEGEIELEDVISYYSAIASLGLHEGYRVLADYFDTTLNLDSEDIREMAC